MVQDLRIVLLPGLDGTARLFGRFLAAAPPGHLLLPTPLPAEPIPYDHLADRIAPTLPRGRLVLTAESFSGAVALAIAERRPVAGLVFCNSFVTAPRRVRLPWLMSPILFRLPVPGVLARHFLLGRAANDELVQEVTDTIASVSPAVLAFRVQSLFSLDLAERFSRCTVPAFYLRGTDDRLVPDSAFRSMAALRPMTTAHVRGPHLLLQANPTEAWRVISPFLDSLRI